MRNVQAIFFAGSALLLHGLPAHAVDRQYTASVAAGWVDTDGGTAFFSNPSSLCPSGSVRYESNYEMTCSNQPRVYGIYSFACPVGYLPDGYPQITWASLITGPYGVGPDGLVYLGIGPGGASACFREMQPLHLTLVGPSQTFPAGLAPYADANFSAIVSNGNGPTAGVQVQFAIKVAANSGGHEHHDDARPAGSLSMSNGISNTNGEVHVRFKAPEVAGTHTITAICGVCSNPSASLSIQVKVPDLLPISPNPPRSADGTYAYALTSVDKTHAGNGRYHHHQYYLTEFSRNNLRVLISAFSEQGWGTVALNDASLPWGGRYDIRADWKSDLAPEERTP